MKYLLLGALTVALLAIFSNASAYDSHEQTFLTLINEYRAENGRQPLLEQPELNVAAGRQSTDLATRIPSTFSHTGSDGSSPSQRCIAAGYTAGCGENIAGGYWTAQSVMQGWKDSPGHNSAMLSSNYKVIGISRVECTVRHDIDQCRYGSYWTTAFGRVITPTTGCSDCDGDGASNALEAWVGTNPSLRCAANTGADNEAVDATPWDVNDDRQVTLTDALRFGPTFNKLAGQSGYDQRFDLNMDSRVTLQDVLMLSRGGWNQSCG